VEREVLMTGIGGQGVQLGAQVMARAAVLEGRHVMLFGSYGGTMRGGPTDSTLVVADLPISSPPIVSRAWSAVVMHHDFWEPVRAKLDPDAVVVLNASLFAGEVDRAALRVFDIEATRIAAELGSPVSASMVMVGAFAGITELLSIECLVEAMASSLPSYRAQHRERNERALRAGFETVPQGAAPAWQEPAA